MSDEKCEFIIKQAEALAAKLEEQPEPDIEVCRAHETLSKGIATSLRMLIPLYKAESTGGLNGVVRQTCASRYGWLTIPVLGFLWLIGHGKGWW